MKAKIAEAVSLAKKLEAAAALEKEAKLKKEELEKFHKENNLDINNNLNDNNKNNCLNIPSEHFIQIENKNTIRSNHINIELQNVASPNKESLNNNDNNILDDAKNKLANDAVSRKQATIKKNMKKSFTNRSINGTQKIKINLEDIEKKYIYKEGRIDGEINPKDPEQMIELYKEVDLLLPRKLVEGKYKKHEICTKFGWFCCGEKFRKSAIENLGVGTDCYFKVLKVFIICFFLISLINIPLYFVYYNNNKDKVVTNYRDALFKLTIGNLASSIFYYLDLIFITYQSFLFN